MASLWIPLQGIPAHGREYILEDQSAWIDPIREFGLECRILEPLRAVFFLLPQEEGILVRGRLTGRVALPCNRCAEDAVVVIDQPIESFEAFPPLPEPAAAKRRALRTRGGRERAEKNETQAVPDAEVMRHTADGRGLELDIASLAWQEFSLALPVKPLCDPACKGLCPWCGVNRNLGSCSCAAEEGDPRLAVLRSLQLGKK